MKTRRFLRVLIWGVLPMLLEQAGSVQAQIPPIMSYQGTLRDPSTGRVVPNANYNLTFRLYEASTGGTHIWEEAHEGVSVRGGVFNVILGDGRPTPRPLTLSNNVPFDRPYWLAVSVNGGPELTPRLKLTSAAYSFNSRRLELPFSGTALSSSAFQIANTSTASSANGIHGIISSTTAGAFSAAVRGESRATGISGIGVYGSQNGGGWGVYGTAPSGIGVFGQHTGTTGTAPGVSGTTNSPADGTSAAGGAAGVFGNALSNDSGEYSAGVLGINSGTTERGGGEFPAEPARAGVLGIVRRNGSGVMGISVGGDGVDGRGQTGVSGSGTQYGVHGQTNQRTGYGGFFINGSGGIALLADGNGSTRNFSALRVHNRQSDRGMAGYFDNSSNFATAHFANRGSGEVLYLQNGGSDANGTGGGDFIKAVNNPENDIQFRVATSGETFSDVGFRTPAADFAEMLPAENGLQPSEVLVISPDGRLARSMQPYQTNVAGVYSTQPGFIGGLPMEGKRPNTVPLAVVGIVPVKVSAENGPIFPGDLLVTSSHPGYAMKAGPNPPNGSIIGKALGTLTGNKGAISVLVMLQ